MLQRGKAQEIVYSRTGRQHSWYSSIRSCSCSSSTSRLNVFCILRRFQLTMVGKRVYPSYCSFCVSVLSNKSGHLLWPLSVKLLPTGCFSVLCNISEKSLETVEITFSPNSDILCEHYWKLWNLDLCPHGFMNCTAAMWLANEIISLKNQGFLEKCLESVYCICGVCFDLSHFWFDHPMCTAAISITGQYTDCWGLPSPHLHSWKKGS